GIAFRAFFSSLFDANAAVRVREALSPQSPSLGLPQPPSNTGKYQSKDETSELPVARQSQPEQKPALTQSPAVTLLSTLQREARLVDFLKEDLTNYSDEQIGAAVRSIHRDSGQVLERLFGIQPVVQGDEGSSIRVPTGFDAARYRLTGHVSGAGPFSGTLQHQGWEVTKCDLPQFTGNSSAASVLAPAEVQIG
ncbi:MAG: DUF2760 domain-containing protein, partial [Planctomycetes bacterium]|nr:DUF2760 domain-containing protein [Planctomycetota bacterium]